MFQAPRKLNEISIEDLSDFIEQRFQVEVRSIVCDGMLMYSKAVTETRAKGVFQSVYSAFRRSVWFELVRLLGKLVLMVIPIKEPPVGERSTGDFWHIISKRFPNHNSMQPVFVDVQASCKRLPVLSADGYSAYRSEEDVDVPVVRIFA